MAKDHVEKKEYQSKIEMLQGLFEEFSSSQTSQQQQYLIHDRSTLSLLQWSRKQSQFERPWKRRQTEAHERRARSFRRAPSNAAIDSYAK